MKYIPKYYLSTLQRLEVNVIIINSIRIRYTIIIYIVFYFLISLLRSFASHISNSIIYSDINSVDYNVCIIIFGFTLICIRRPSRHNTSTHIAII